MKTHTTQWSMMLWGLLFSGAVLAQGRHNNDDRDSRNGRDERSYRGKDDDDGHGHSSHSDRYHDHGDRNGRYNYPVTRYQPVAPPNEFRGRRPSPYHVWMPCEYRWGRGGYVYYPGYWMVPPRQGMQYVPGYWQPSRNGGFIWISGFWSGGSIGVRW